MISKLLLKYKVIFVILNINSYTEKEKQFLKKIELKKNEDYFLISLIDGTKLKKNRKTIKFIDYETGVEIKDIQGDDIKNTFLINESILKKNSILIKTLIFLVMIVYFLGSLVLLNNKRNISFYSLSVLTILVYFFINKFRLVMKRKTINSLIVKMKK